MKLLNLIAVLILFYITSCSGEASKKKNANNNISKLTDTVSTNTGMPAQKNRNDLATILAKKEVPVLCYHHIREAKRGQSERMKSYSVSPEFFAEQMKALKDSGYQTILPDDLYNYLVYNGKLPPKPIMLTFDDANAEQYSIGAKEMQKNGFKGVFFIMTIGINRRKYISQQQLKALADSGNAVESHTWDHHMVTGYQGEDWDKQIIKPRKTIEDITGAPANYFAYPYGLWNEAAFPELKKAGFKLAFILSTKRDTTDPLMTIRRMIVPGTWTINGTVGAMNKTFHLKK